MRKLLAAFVTAIALVFAGVQAPAQAVESPLLMTFNYDDASDLLLQLPMHFGSTPNAVIDWGDGTPTTSATSKGTYSHTYAATGIYQVAITGTLGAIGHNGAWPTHMRNLISLDQFGTGLESAAILLSGAKRLTSVPAELPARFTDTSWMFYYGSVPSQVAGWNMSNVQNMSSMFYSSDMAVDISSWNLSGLDPSTPDVFNDGSPFIGAGWMLQDTPMTKETYSSILAAWSTQTLASGIYLGGPQAGYCDYAMTSRSALAAKGWTISDGGQKTCTPPPPAAPGEPGQPTVVPGDGEANLSWLAPTTGTAPFNYTITSDPAGASCEITGTTAVCTGLTNGQGYTFIITASNAGGSTDSPTSQMVTPESQSVAPSAPSAPTVTPGDGQVTLNWDEPSSGTGPLTYQVDSNPAGANCTITGTSAVCTGLTNGTAYTFTVTASNSAGESTSQVSSSVTPSSGSNSNNGGGSDGGSDGGSSNWNMFGDLASTGPTSQNDLIMMGGTAAFAGAVFIVATRRRREKELEENPLYLALLARATLLNN